MRWCDFESIVMVQRKTAKSGGWLEVVMDIGGATKQWILSYSDSFAVAESANAIPTTLSAWSEGVGEMDNRRCVIWRGLFLGVLLLWIWKLGQFSTRTDHPLSLQIIGEETRNQSKAHPWTAVSTNEFNRWWFVRRNIWNSSDNRSCRITQEYLEHPLRIYSLVP